MSYILQTTVSTTPTVSNGTAYAAGDNVGGKLLFTGAFVTAKHAGDIRKVLITDADAQSANFDLILFNSDPSGSTFTDNAAQAIAAADRSKIIAVISITTHCVLSGSAISYRTSLVDFAYSMAAGSLYGCLVTRSTPTYTSTTALSIYMDIIQD